MVTPKHVECSRAARNSQHNRSMDMVATENYEKIDDILEAFNRKDSIAAEAENIYTKYDCLKGISLYPHQEVGVKWMCEMEEQYDGGLLADEMGMGKTQQIIGLLLARPENRTLIVVPLSMMDIWVTSIKQLSRLAHNQKLKAIKYHGTNRDLHLHQNSEYKYVVITTYDIVVSEVKLKARNENLREGEPHSALWRVPKWDRIILDEAHVVRNSETKKFKSIIKLSQKCAFRWCVSGTPINNKPEDLLSLLRVTQFEENKFKIGMAVKPGKSPWVQWFKHLDYGDDRCLSLEATKRLKLVASMFGLRRTPLDKNAEGQPLIVMSEKKVEHVNLKFSTDESELQRTYHKHCNEEVASIIKRGSLPKSAACMFAMLTRLRQLCIHPSLVTFKVSTCDGPDCKKKETNPVEACQLLTHELCKECCLKFAEDDECPVCDSAATGTNNFATRYPESKSLLKKEREKARKIFDAWSLRDVRGKIVRSTKTKWILKEMAERKPTEKIVVFCSFVAYFKEVLGEVLNEEEIKYVMYHGEMTIEDREAKLKNFRDDMSVSVCLMSLMAANVGINLQHATKAIIVDPWWNPAVEMQAEARIWRIGQEKNVSIFKLLIDDSVEMRVKRAQRVKMTYIDAAFGEEESRETPLSVGLVGSDVYSLAGLITNQTPQEIQQMVEQEEQQRTTQYTHTARQQKSEPQATGSPQTDSFGDTPRTTRTNMHTTRQQKSEPQATEVTDKDPECDPLDRYVDMPYMDPATKTMVGWTNASVHPTPQSRSPIHPQIPHTQSKRTATPHTQISKTATPHTHTSKTATPHTQTKKTATPHITGRRSQAFIVTNTRAQATPPTEHSPPAIALSTTAHRRTAQVSPAYVDVDKIPTIDVDAISSPTNPRQEAATPTSNRPVSAYIDLDTVPDEPTSNRPVSSYIDLDAVAAEPTSNRPVSPDIGDM
ncbi:hypothetical protein SARC_06863 [Sphaeroforma arctica JP610]|uniref:DNA repair protein RAD16 n=1 Tax=Sphaeroforma arctica JP610 TaxID=667725 RepID=A0A0L0FVW0_9EUKA|nr:hypothetical protein SARC_06863 [Sphaeroforma arctica JP610]KNC80784.1 hypothetical protein SARC_06863 [Sphaeroforma arctica JP610]|eukprot:XP_014154686.1 hypothetical protein SARC_06863 [Sphaeroforma arctica JP610]